MLILIAVHLLIGVVFTVLMVKIFGMEEFIKHPLMWTNIVIWPFTITWTIFNHFTGRDRAPRNHTETQAEAERDAQNQ